MSIEFSTIAFAPIHEGKFEFTPFPSALPKRNALLADLYEDDEDSMNPPMGFEDSGYFRQTDWFKRLYGLIVLQDKVDVDLVDVCRKTIEWVPAIIMTPKVHEYYTGLRAYDAYIEKMQDDSEFPKGRWSITMP